MSTAHTANINSSSTSVERIIARRGRVHQALADLPADSPKRPELEAELADLTGKVDAVRAIIDTVPSP